MSAVASTYLFFFNDTATTEIYTLSLHDALPICNTAIIRSNYLTPEGVRFYDRSVKLYEHLSVELNFNVMFAQRGHLTLAHNDGGLRTMHWRAEVNKLEGVDSEVIGPEEIKELVPYMDTSKKARYPILGALYHPPGGIIRHDEIGRAHV